MCYPARVRQNLKQLSRRYSADVDWSAFEDLYRRRAEGEDIKASRDLQRNFQHPETAVEQRTAESIAQYLKTKKAEWENEIFVQRRRLAAAEESLVKRETKKAREEIRIGTSKVQALLDRLADLRRTEPNNEDACIFPMMYAPVLVRHDGKTTILLKLNNSSAYSMMRSKGLNSFCRAGLCAIFAYNACSVARQVPSVARPFRILSSFNSSKGPTERSCRQHNDFM